MSFKKPLAFKPRLIQCANCGEVKFVHPNGLCKSCLDKIVKQKNDWG